MICWHEFPLVAALAYYAVASIGKKKVITLTSLSTTDADMSTFQ